MKRRDYQEIKINFRWGEENSLTKNKDTLPMRWRKQFTRNKDTLQMRWREQIKKISVWQFWTTQVNSKMGFHVRLQENKVSWFYFQKKFLYFVWKVNKQWMHNLLRAILPIKVAVLFIINVQSHGSLNVHGVLFQRSSPSKDSFLLQIHFLILLSLRREGICDEWDWIVMWIFFLHTIAPIQRSSTHLR